MKRPRALIVEDNILIVLDLEDIVERAGCEVAGTTTDVPRALAILQSEHVDIALVDCRLDQEDCSAVVEELRKQKLPFVICSGMDRSTLEKQYPDGTIITKPYLPQQVIDALEALLGEPA